MKLKDYKKMDQLDRIEFLLRLDRVESRKILTTPTFIIYMFAFQLLFSILTLTIFLTTENLEMLKLLPGFLPVFKFGIILCLIIDICFYVSYRLKKYDLEKEFLSKNGLWKNKNI